MYRFTFYCKHWVQGVKTNQTPGLNPVTKHGIQCPATHSCSKKVDVIDRQLQLDMDYRVLEKSVFHGVCLHLLTSQVSKQKTKAMILM